MTREQSYEIAFEKQKEVLTYKKAVFEMAIANLSKQNPEFADINNRLAQLGSSIAITVISGDTASLDEMQSEMTALSSRRDEILKQAGITDIKYDCSVCRDTGYVNGKICNCIHNSAKKLVIESLSSALPLEDCRFDNFDLNYYPQKSDDGTSPRKNMTAVLKMCREYVTNFDPCKSESLLFMGNTGLGKTHLTIAIVYELLNRGFNVIYGAAYNLFSEMESEHFDRHTNTAYKAAIDCDLLVIDDLGGEFVSPYIQSLFYNIVNTRDLANKPTIINTNLAMGDIAARYTPRVASRLFNYNNEVFTGDDIRLQKAIQKNN
ncbi:MAG: ATP-binding protein [Clostridia bacterium]|nr:ATP-binding protein [Clostridia bacterium]